MNPQRALRLLTIAFLVVGVVSLSWELQADDWLPPLLLGWQKNAHAQTSVSVWAIFGVILISCLLAMLVASAALLQMKKWGAYLHLSATVAILLTIPFVGPAIQHPVSYALDGASMLIAGALYGVAFFSDALSAKERTARRSESETRP